MKTFTFAKLSKLGEPDPKYGVIYWGDTNEQLEPVKFNSMNQNITTEDTITAEEVLLKTSTKGTEYHQLKKVKVVDSATQPAIHNRVTYDPSQLDRIEQKLDQLLGHLIGDTNHAPQTEDELAEQLNEIFPPETDE